MPYCYKLLLLIFFGFYDVYFQAVRRDNKQRFGLLEENGELLIRANQGHTVTVISPSLSLQVCIWFISWVGVLVEDCRSIFWSSVFVYAFFLLVLYVVSLYSYKRIATLKFPKWYSILGRSGCYRPDMGLYLILFGRNIY